MIEIDTSQYNNGSWAVINFDFYLKLNPVRDWCRENGSGEKYYFCGGGLCFENEKDAILFALRWS